jgi:G3E family GTPase
MSQIPVLVLSGFLGSGKTTLLRRLLHYCAEKGWRPAVLMNELGKTDTDGAIIAGEYDAMVEKLLDGCMCCNKKSEVVQCVQKLLQQDPDLLLIELTGVADPEEVMDSLTEPQLKDKLCLYQLITLLDAENILTYNSIFEADRQLVRTTRSQIKVADVLVLNKIDLVPLERQVKIEKAIRKQNPVSPVYYTTFSELDLELLLAQLPGSDCRDSRTEEGRRADRRQDQRHTGQTANHHHHHHDHHHQQQSYSRVVTFTLPVPYPLSARAVEKFLKKWRPNLLRAKGYLPLAGRDTTYLMQHVLKRTDWQPAAYHGEYYLVMIGIDLDIEKVKEEWTGLTLKHIS